MNTYKTLSHVQIKVHYLNFDINFKFLYWYFCIKKWLFWVSYNYVMCSYENCNYFHKILHFYSKNIFKNSSKKDKQFTVNSFPFNKKLL